MQLSLDSTEKFVSLCLGVIAFAGIVFRKIILPKYQAWNAAKRKKQELFDSIPNLKAELLEVKSKLNKFVEEEITLKLKEIKNIFLVDQERIHILFEELGVACFQADQNGKCIWVNRRTEDLFGASEENLLENGWLDYLRWEDYDITRQKWNDSVAHNTNYKVRYRIVNKIQHREILCEAMAYPIVAADKTVLGFFGKVVEIIDKENV